MIRVVLPSICGLWRVDGETKLDVAGPATQPSVLP